MAKTLCATPVPVGIGTPGQVDNVNGVVRAIANLNITELALGPEVAARLGVPTHVENDVNAAALGAKAVDAGDVDAGDTVVFLNFGTGLAAGVVCGGKAGERLPWRVGGNRPCACRSQSLPVPLCPARLLGNHCLRGCRGAYVAL